MKYLLILKLFVLLPTFALCQTYEVRRIDGDDSVKTQWDQEYARKQLYAVLDNIDYLIAPTHERWIGISLEVIYEGDLDQDGLADAVVQSYQGGQCCAPYYFVVSYRGNGFFSVHHMQGMYGYKIRVKEAYGELLIKVLDQEQPVESAIGSEDLYTFRFYKGELELVSHATNEALVPAIVEVTAKDVKDENKTIIFDVDDDGIDEEILATYWDRWGSVKIGNIYTSSRGTVTLSYGCSRIGFMSSTTNGLHDVVCDRRDILRYDTEGNRYQ